MAVLLEVLFQDINQVESKSSMWIESEEVVGDVLIALKAASNAKILRATLSIPVALDGLSNNDAYNDNVSTAACRAIIGMRGIDADSSGEPYARVHVGIPAPNGDLAAWVGAGAHAADVSGLIDLVKSKTGVQMTNFDSIKYNR